MTDDQINAAIAEACGWTEIQECTCWDDVSRGKAPGKIGLKHIEDYCNDLNAMHEAEHSLPYVQLCDYLDRLISVSFEAALAPARQRAEAFLRTLGKWEEVQR